MIDAQATNCPAARSIHSFLSHRPAEKLLAIRCPRYGRKMMSRSDELEEMKRIDLCQYVASRGYVLDRRQSSRASAVMRHANGDKLIVARPRDGQFVYFNAKGDDSGSIIDFIQSRDRVSLGEVRKILRPWLGRSALPAAELPSLNFELQPSEHDTARVLAAWMSARPLRPTHKYLVSDRCVPREIIEHEVFRDRIRVDDRNNLVFPHFTVRAGLCGFELKNRGFTGFSPGGIKGLACSRPRADDHEMIVCETAVDMLSYAALHGVDGRRFFSTAGQISPVQAECLRGAVERMPPNARVVLALDNDDGGRQLAQQIRNAIDAGGHPVENHFPAIPGEDWNDVLKQTKSSRVPKDSPVP